MQVGDLVRWTNPEQFDVGIIIEIEGLRADIVWQREPEYNGSYPIKSVWLEAIDENR